jgi:hypothetical protein
MRLIRFAAGLQTGTDPEPAKRAAAGPPGGRIDGMLQAAFEGLGHGLVLGLDPRHQSLGLLEALG